MMHRVFQTLGPAIRLVVRFAPFVLLIAILFSVLGVRYAMRLSIDTDLSNLIPNDYESAQALERLRETVGGESEAAIGIQSPSFEANKEFAEDLIPRVLLLRDNERREPYFQRVEYRKDTEFLKNNALYFTTPTEMDMLEGWLEDQIVASREEANPFLFDLADEEEDAEPDSVGEELQAVYSQIVSREYPISDDSTTMVLQFYPAEASSNIQFLENAYADLDSLISEMGPASYHPEMKITTAGRLLRQLTEIKTIQRDVLGSTGTGVGAVLLIVILYFLYKSYTARVGTTFNGRILIAELLRIPVLAIIIGLPLIMSLTWTFGVAELVYGQLNLMTSTLGLVLFGLGIDYGIHFFARYTEERSLGCSVVDAVERTFRSTGQAITVGALTTALALFILVVADFQGFSQFGFMAGTGIIFALLAMTVVLPALVAIFEKGRLINLKAVVESAEVGSGRIPGVKPILIGSIIAVVVALIFIPKVSFEYRFGVLEPSYEEYEARRAVIREVYNDRRSRNPAYVVVDSPEEVASVTRAIRQKIEADTLSPTIDRVESLQDRFPTTPQARERKLERLADIRELLDDSFLRQDSTQDMIRLRQAAQTDQAIELEEVPEFLREQFTSKSGELGNFVIVYPSVGLSDGRQSIAFSEDVGTIVTEDGNVYHAGSTSLVAADMLRLMRSEAPWMIIGSFVVVFFLMYLNFGQMRWMLLALLPLVVGVLWMLLMMEFIDLNLNFYNLIVLPAVLGIGNDAGVHLVHRYQEEGPGSLRHVLRSTGEHVAMGSITTMVGFGGLLLSFHPGLESIGQLAVIGIGATLVAALLFLPALIQWMEDRGGVERRSERG